MYNNLLESSLHHLVLHPTRNDDILDLILTTNENIITKVEVGSEFSTSDHRAIAFSIKFFLNESKEKYLIFSEQILLNSENNFG